MPLTANNRALVTPAKRGRGNKAKATDEEHDRRSAEQRVAMTWAQRLKRVFGIDIKTCHECGGTVKVIACIDDLVVIEKILSHLQEKLTSAPAGLRPASRAPPADLFG